MSYVGNTVTTQGFIPAVDYFNGTGSATAFTLSKPVASVAQVQAVISNVVQNPSDAYTVSGSTITFTSAPPTGTNNVYVYYTSPITQVIAPGQGTVTTTSFASSTGTGAVVLATSPTITTPTISQITSATATALTLQSAGTTAITVDTSQNVGIGTTSPSCKLELATTNQSFKITGSGASNWLTIANTTRSYNIGIDNAVSGFNIYDNTSSAYRMVIDSSGNLLVGTTSQIGSGRVNVLATSGTNGINCQANVNANSVFGGYNAAGSATFYVTGNGAVTKASGTFCIEHPLPELKDTHNLVHSFIEGPQADLIYRGKVNLVNGTASINIDQTATMSEGTFILLCRNVQCFTTNESDWIPVRGSVTGNILTIEAQDNTSTASISWMVIGERQDKHMYETGWTDDNGKPIVEPLKVVNV